MSIQSKFATTRKELASTMIERDEEIDILLTALLCKEHALLVGEPGTGKSMLSDAIVNWMGGNKFTILLGRYTTPEEVFGPVSISALKEDRYLRILKGKLPYASVAFMDEIFKASTAILNTMLQILNERTYMNDDTLIHCPLQLCLAASNEWPGDQEGAKELGALFDRFLFRKLVRPIASEKSLQRLMWSDKLSVSLSTTISPAEIEAANVEVTAVTWSEEAKAAFSSILRECRKEGISPGDRRIRKSVQAARAFTWLQGALEVEPDHLEILGHTLWADPTEQPRTLAEIVGRVANPAGMAVNSLIMEAEGLIASCDLKDLASTATVSKKLAEVVTKLKKCSGLRATQARDYVAEEIKRIRLAAVEAMG